MYPFPIVYKITDLNVPNVAAYTEGSEARQFIVQATIFSIFLAQKSEFNLWPQALKSVNSSQGERQRKRASLIAVHFDFVHVFLFSGKYLSI